MALRGVEGNEYKVGHHPPAAEFSPLLYKFNRPVPQPENLHSSVNAPLLHGHWPD